MKEFRFVILGAAKIAPKFAEAVSLVDGAVITAVASKSMERAKAFAANYGIRAYDDYEQMLIEEKPDAAYICVTPNDHMRLTLLCLKYKIPVLCEKAMFMNSKEAIETFAAAKKAGVFVMEAMWSRFLPPTQKVKAWLKEGRIGRPDVVHATIGFKAPPDHQNRYLNPALGGGAARDITVYTYEQTCYILEQEQTFIHADAIWGPSGVDMTDHVYVRYSPTMADMVTSFAMQLPNVMEICGPEGRILFPDPNMPEDCSLCAPDGTVIEHFMDTETPNGNGFVYEIAEVMRCVRAGLLESPTVPWQTTIDCAKVFDLIDQTR